MLLFSPFLVVRLHIRGIVAVGPTFDFKLPHSHPGKDRHDREQNDRPHIVVISGNASHDIDLKLLEVSRLEAAALSVHIDVIFAARHRRKHHLRQIAALAPISVAVRAVVIFDTDLKWITYSGIVVNELASSPKPAVFDRCSK